jgi:hypothetical protein
VEIVLIQRKVRQGGGLSHKDSDGYNKIIRLLTLQYFFVVNTSRKILSTTHTIAFNMNDFFSKTVISFKIDLYDLTRGSIIDSGRTVVECWLGIWLSGHS